MKQGRHVPGCDGTPRHYYFIHNSGVTANIQGLPANHGYQSTTYQMAAEVGVLTRNIKVQKCVPVESVPPAAVAVCCGGCLPQ